ncbi:MAG: hypothetical protein ACOYK8_09230 [Alphaproteobacteria bacterium]
MFSYFPVFTVYNEMFKLGVQTSQMFFSSAEVIMHRSVLISLAMVGKIPWNDPEFTKLWQEKISANMESYNIASKKIIDQSADILESSAEENLANGIKAVTDSTLPYHKKADANAKRLREHAL